jgi:hypothetical protein
VILTGKDLVLADKEGGLLDLLGKDHLCLELEELVLESKLEVLTVEQPQLLLNRFLVETEHLLHLTLGVPLLRAEDLVEPDRELQKLRGRLRDHRLGCLGGGQRG